MTGHEILYPEAVDLVDRIRQLKAGYLFINVYHTRLI